MPLVVALLPFLGAVVVLILLAVAGTAVAALVVPMRAVACSPTRQAIAPWSAELSRFTAYTVAPKRANPPANLRT